MTRLDLAGFISAHLSKGGGAFIPARVQACLALLEHLREQPSLTLTDHLAPAGHSVNRHESLGDAVHERLGLTPINKNHGRRSSAIHEWGQPLLDFLDAAHFTGAGAEERSLILDELQRQLAELLQDFHDREPIVVRPKGKSVAAVVGDILTSADAKGQAAAVAQYLVGAKLQLRFPARRGQIKPHAVNRGDRKGWADPASRRGDFDLGDYIFEVSVGGPDSKHLRQIEDILEDRDVEVWLLVRQDRLAIWSDEIARCDIDHNRAVVTSIELFVGQNIAELGDLLAEGQRDRLEALVSVYNSEWMPSVGSPGLRIEFK